MQVLKREIAAFKGARQIEVMHAQQMVALRLVCGMDLSKALDSGPAVAAAYATKVRRLLERERIRGAQRHWSYDLNRHIALKQVLDRLQSAVNRPQQT